MRLLEKGAPAAAIFAALSTHCCCVPMGFLGVVGVASARVWMPPLRLWLLGASAILLGIGFVRLYFQTSCVRHSTSSLVLFWAAVAVVLLAVFFPQMIPSFIAG